MTEDGSSEKAMTKVEDNAPVDPFDLNRFIEAQAGEYQQASSELQAGLKQSHWMWFIFPQFQGLGSSPTSVHYAIKSEAEARAYLAHPVLGPRLVRCVVAVLELEGKSASEIFGFPDDLKLKSSATLFAAVSPPGSVFDQLLGRYFNGQRDEKTIGLLGK
jgi:uncharacterized protein (DUF1810 family)